MAAEIGATTAERRPWCTLVVLVLLGSASLDARAASATATGRPERSHDGRAAGLSPVTIEIGTGTGAPDELVYFDVRLNTGGQPVAAIEIDIAYDPATAIAPHPNPVYAGAPFCDVHPAINKNDGGFTFVGANHIHASVLSTSNSYTIPDGSVLFRCYAAISETTVFATYALTCSGAQARTPTNAVLPSSCTPGSIVVQAHVIVDHYKCYQGTDLKDPKLNKVDAATADQVSVEQVTLLKIFYVCAPVDKNGEGINDPNTHLVCYGIKATRLSEPRPRALVSSQVQMTQFELKKPKLLCVPATKTLLP
jgi:hypothetical protein